MTDDRPQPRDDNAERALLGALLLAPNTANIHITGDDFHHPSHTAIYAAIAARTSRNQPVDPLLIAQDLAGTHHLAKMPGGAAYLHTCVAACPDPSHAPHYADIIAGHAAARGLLHLSEDLAKAALVDDPQRRAELVAAAHTTLGKVGTPTKINGHNIRLTPASAFRIKAVKWVWEGRMPLGEITLIPGREGVGKSIYLAWLAAAITNGNLPGIHHGQPKAVLYAASEDAWSYTIAPRMAAAGADLDLVYRIDIETEDGGVQGLNLPRDCRHLPDIAAEVDAAALMCDPIMSLVDASINNFKAQELRTALEPLRRAAEEARIAVPALVHFNKGAGGDVGTMIAGARTWSEVARAVVAIAQDKEADEYACVVSQTKNNLGRLDLPNLGFTIDSVVLETDEGEAAHVGRLRWTGESDVSAEDLLTGDPSDRPLSDNTSTIIDFVDDADRPIPVQDVIDNFEGRIKANTVRQTLARCVKRGDLVSQTRGMYETAKTSKRRTKGARRRPDSGPSLYPPVTTSQVSLTQVSSGIESVTREDDRVTSVTSGGSDTCDVVTQGIVRAGAREGKIHSVENQPTLVSCTNCFAPLTDVDGSGRHPACTPAESEDDKTQREWYP